MDIKRPLIFVGSRNLINDMAIAAEADGREVVGVLDKQFWGNQDWVGSGKIPVIGSEDWLLDADNVQAQQWLRTCDFIVASYWDGGQHVAGSFDPGQVRLRQINMLEQSGANIINLIHPSASVDGLYSRYGDIKIGRGVFLNRGFIMVSAGITIGDHFVGEGEAGIGDGVTIGRNTIMSCHAQLYQCSVGSNVYMGAHSRVNIWHKKAPIIIGNNVTIFTNAEIIKDVPDGHMYTADGRILRKRKVLDDAQGRVVTIP
jgi:acetyltransferase-like isoleucine patch superfamily enzyme